MNEYIREIAVCFIVLIISGAIYNEARADNTHRVYTGIHWTHLSNVDAGEPFYSDRAEDSADHIGVDVEYQYHPNEQGYAFISLGIGASRFNSAKGGSVGWNCDGCSLPSTLRVGYKWRIQ